MFETKFLRGKLKDILHEFYLIAYKHYFTKFLPERLNFVFNKAKLYLLPALIIKYNFSAYELDLSLK